MLLWLDDVRNPKDYGAKNYMWAKTAEDAVSWLRDNLVEFASLDHDLTHEQMVRGGYNGEIHDDGVKSGYDVVLWLEEHPEFWPPQGVRVHSANPAGKQRMEQVIFRHYGHLFQSLPGKI